jgi:hypothetical protein
MRATDCQAGAFGVGLWQAPRGTSLHDGSLLLPQSDARAVIREITRIRTGARGAVYIVRWCVFEQDIFIKKI